MKNGINIGGMNINSIDERNGTFGTGMQIHPEHRGKGFGIVVCDAKFHHPKNPDCRIVRFVVRHILLIVRERADSRTNRLEMYDAGYNQSGKLEFTGFLQNLS